MATTRCTTVTPTRGHRRLVVHAIPPLHAIHDGRELLLGLLFVRADGSEDCPVLVKIVVAVLRSAATQPHMRGT